MKKTVITAFAMFATCGIARAQSDVTIYGLLDAGINWNSNAAGQQRWDLSSGVASGSRLGIRGTEDIGAGTAGIFLVESGFDSDTGAMGQGGRIFGRQSYVGLASQQDGTLTLGRQYDSGVDLMAQYNFFAQIGGYMSARPADVDNFNNAHRINHAVKYTSPVAHGLKLSSLYGFGSGAGGAGRNQIWSAGVNYSNGESGIAVTYLNVRDPNTSFFSDSSSTPATGNMSGPVYSGFSSASRYQVIGVGGNHKIADVILGMVYSNVSFVGLGNPSAGPNPYGYGGTAEFNSLEGSISYRIIAPLVAGVAYDYVQGSSLKSAERARYNQISAGLDYFVSTRSDLYLAATYQKASGVDSTGRSATASINGPVPASGGSSQSLIRIGIRHRF